MSKSPEDGWVRLTDKELHPRKDRRTGLIIAALGTLILVTAFLFGISDSDTPRPRPDEAPASESQH